MSLDALISYYVLLDGTLRRSMSASGGAQIRANLLRKSADVLQRIEEYQPTSEQEARDQIYFFVSRAIARPGLSVSGRDIDIAVALTQSGEPQAEEDLTDPSPRSEPLRQDEISMISFVVQSKERVSLFDDQIHYIATSVPNAEFYGTRPARIVGVALADVVGEDMLSRVGRRQFEAARSGEPQEFYYPIDVVEERRVMRCQIKPMILGIGVRAFLVFHRDVTDEVAILDETLRVHTAA